jgi:type I restriction-modification system DNA methylase subunit
MTFCDNPTMRMTELGEREENNKSKYSWILAILYLIDPDGRYVLARTNLRVFYESTRMIEIG